MTYFDHRFTGRVTTHTFRPKSGVGRSLTYRVVFLPSELELTLQFGKGSRARFIGEVNGAPVQAAWQSAPGRGHYAMLSEATLKLAGVDEGDDVEVAFRLVADSFVLVPDDLTLALERAPRASAAWELLSAAVKRAHVAELERAKVTATRVRRIEALVATLSSRVSGALRGTAIAHRRGQRARKR